MNEYNNMTRNQDEEAFEKFYLPKRKLMWEHLHGDQIAFDVWQAACEYKDVQLEQERAKSQKLVEALEHYKGKSLLIQNLSGIARGQVSVFDVVTVYIEEDERWLVGDVAEKALEEYKAKEGGE